MAATIVDWTQIIVASCDPDVLRQQAAVDTKVDVDGSRGTALLDVGDRAAGGIVFSPEIL